MVSLVFGGLKHQGNRVLRLESQEDSFLMNVMAAEMASPAVRRKASPGVVASLRIDKKHRDERI